MSRSVGREALAAAVEQAQHGALRLHDPAVVDDLLLGVGDVPHQVVALALEERVLDQVELEADLVQDREAVVVHRVDDLVEQEARALAHVLLAGRLAALAARPQGAQRLQRLVGERDHQVLGNEEVQLRRLEPPRALVEAREVQDDEQVVGVLVDLRPLAPPREHVLEVEGVEVVVLGQPGGLELGRRLDVQPREPVRLEALDVRPGAVSPRLVRGPSPAPLASADLREVRHRRCSEVG